jgi:integrase
MRISALRFLYKRTLKRKDLAFDDLIFPKVPHKLPTVLSQEEVVRLIDAAPNRLDRILLVLLYATGARRAEAARIKVEDIDSQRMVIHIRQGKGAKDRDVPLSPKLLEELRTWWRWKKPQGTSFPVPRASGEQTNLSPTRLSGTHAIEQQRAPDSRRRSTRIPCAIVMRRTCSRPAPTCARFRY